VTKKLLLLLALATIPGRPAERIGEIRDGDTISTDRPDYTESTDVVPLGNLQLEGGTVWGVHQLAAGPLTSLASPSPLIRFGLSKRVELRWGSDGFVSESQLTTANPDRHTGTSDMNAGLKIRLWQECRSIPSVAIIGAMSFPVGGQFFSSTGRDPLVKICWSKTLPRGFDIGGNFNSRWIGSEAVTERAVSLTAGRKVAWGIRIYGEYYRISPIDGDEVAHATGNAGITKLLGRQAQVDIEVGHTLNARTPCWFVGLGFAFRFATRPQSS
jgi:Putative MetA-pathway of phenol degradation